MSKIKRPGVTAGLRHLALNVIRLDDTVDFYTRLLGMQIEWQPDADNYYLSSGNDNLALHRTGGAKQADMKEETIAHNKISQALDHLGFIIDVADDVYVWFDFLKQENVVMLTEVKDHRDDARSFYCKDPDGNAVQIIYHPPLSSGS